MTLPTQTKQAIDLYLASLKSFDRLPIQVTCDESNNPPEKVEKGELHVTVKAYRP